MADEERVRKRAHEIWEREGRPSGQETRHWEQAKSEIEQEDAEIPEVAPQSGAGGLPSGLQPGGTIPGGGPGAGEGSIGTGGSTGGKPSGGRRK